MQCWFSVVAPCIWDLQSQKLARFPKAAMATYNTTTLVMKSLHKLGILHRLQVLLVDNNSCTISYCFNLKLHNFVNVAFPDRVTEIAV